MNKPIFTSIDTAASATVRNGNLLRYILLALSAMLMVMLLALLAGPGAPGVLAQAGEGDSLRAERPGGHGDNNPGPETHIAGYLRARPDAPALGDWQLETAIGQMVTVIVTTTTRMDDGLPELGAWVEVRALLTGDGVLLATRLRPDDYEDQEVVVRLASGVISTTVATRHDCDPLKTLLGSANIVLLSVDDDEQTTLQRLRADPDVIWAEVNYTNAIPGGKGYKTWRWGGEDASGYINQWAFDQVKLTAALSSTQGAGVVVAVLDTGIHLQHSALAGRLADGWDMMADDAIANDDGPGFGWGHGTHVAGIIARMAPQSQIMPVRVLDSNGRGSVFALAYGIEWAVAHGADVINLSLGADAGSRLLGDVIEEAQAHGVIVVAAAGNENSDTRQFPAGFAGVIGVAAVDHANVKADFSNFGAQWVDIAAPGVGITSTVPYTSGNGYASWSGTSMSTAFVSGAAALVRGLYPSLTPSQVSDRLLQSALDLDPFNTALSGQLGGLLDVAAALAESAPNPQPTPDPQPTPQPPPHPGDPTTPLKLFYLPLITR